MMQTPTSDATQKKARDRLLALRKVCNQAVGDAVSMLFAVVGVMGVQSLSVEDWDALYSDLPCVQAKVSVPDRKKAVPNASETRLVEPESLQNKIDALVKQYPQARSFVRPSGTEDIIRVYAEAASPEDAQSLADAVGKAVVEEFGAV
jgi:phosphoacetylglucosamine mutase